MEFVTEGAPWAAFKADVAKVSASQLLKAKQQLAMEKKLCEDIDKLQSQVSNSCSKTSTPVPSQPAPLGMTAPPPYCYGYRQTPPNMGQYQQLAQPLVQVPQPAPQLFPVVQTPQVPQTPQTAALFGTAAPISRGNLFYSYQGGVPQTPMRG
ncbi:hypothetical protein F4604DRAFT_1919079 [Suillus subluteus]|nr:hypothetical protein F4604DRAFT_1919079 [Suillus subluteus]